MSAVMPGESQYPWTPDEREEEKWKVDALCAETDPEAFFPEKGGSTREAKRVCGECSVAAQCLEYALRNDERFGIWGGMSERERRKLKQGARPAPARPRVQRKPRRSWTAGELATLREMNAARKSDVAIGRALDRDPGTGGEEAHGAGYLGDGAAEAGVVVSGADLLVDGFPHGTKAGYQQGCRGAACPTGVELGLSCREANTRYHADWSFQKRVDAGASVAELAAELRAPVKKAAPKGKSRRHGDLMDNAVLEEELFPQTRVRSSRPSVDAVVAERAAERPSRKGAPKPSVPTLRPAELVRPVPQIEEDVMVTETVEVSKRGRRPAPHGTQQHWRKYGCRDASKCPGGVDGKTCSAAHEEWLAARRKGGAPDTTQEGGSTAQEGAEGVELLKPATDPATHLGSPHLPFPPVGDGPSKMFELLGDAGVDVVLDPASPLSDAEAAEVDRFGADYDDDGLLGEPVPPLPLGEPIYTEPITVEVDAAAVIEPAANATAEVSVEQLRERFGGGVYEPTGRHGGLLDDFRRTQRERDEALGECDRLRAENDDLVRRLGAAQATIEAVRAFETSLAVPPVSLPVTVYVDFNTDGTKRVRMEVSA